MSTSSPTINSSNNSSASSSPALKKSKYNNNIAIDYSDDSQWISQPMLSRTADCWIVFQKNKFNEKLLRCKCCRAGIKDHGTSSQNRHVAICEKGTI
jgi:hypothetical protein